MDEYKHIKKQDPEVFAAIEGEEKREAEGLELIPSENYVSKAVREANSSILTNKYSEGYPGKRYYGGQKYTDMVETLAIERAKKLFDAKYANVQTLGGANANIAMYFALLNPGDTVLGMDLSHGGHLTHGHPVTYLTKIFNFVRYKMKDPDTGEIDYDELRRVALEHKPKIILAGFSAYSRELDYAKFTEIAKEVGAYTVADMAHIAGLIAGKAARNPFDDGFDVITTTTHKTLRGPRGGMILTRESEEIATKIKISLAAMGQDQRHRTIRRSAPQFTGDFYLPPILRELGLEQEAISYLNEWKKIGRFAPETLVMILAPYGAMATYEKAGSFNAIAHEQGKRLCWCAQEEIYHLGKLQRLAIEEKFGKKHPLLNIFEPPCYRNGKCTEGDRYCGRDRSQKLRNSDNYFPKRKI